MLLQAALNGGNDADRHPAVPRSVEQLAFDAAACFRAGARAVHLHPRGDDGAETLDALVVDSTVETVRAGFAGPIGVSTGAWIEPDARMRARRVRAWTAPDMASVNIAEAGFEHVLLACVGAGIAVEAGIGSIEDVAALAASGLADRVLRVLVEPDDPPLDAALDVFADIHDALDAFRIRAPRLQHSSGAATWIVLEDAIRRDLDTRIGFEDTALLPDGTAAASNAELVRAAIALGAGT